MPAPGLPSPEETVRLYQNGELAAELARHHGSADGETRFIAQCVALHNVGRIDLLAVASTPAFAVITGHSFFVAQHLYCEAIPELHADVRPLMVCCGVLIKQAGQDMAATQPNLAFQRWCTVNQEQARTVIQQAREGDDLAGQFVTFALRSLNDIGEAITFIEEFADNRRLFGMAALAGMHFADGDAAHRAVRVLAPFVEEENDDNIRSNALLAAFDVLKSYPNVSVAAALIKAATKMAGAATLHGLARLVWLHHNQLDGPSLRMALESLLDVPRENLGTIRTIDHALHDLIGTQNERLALDYITEVLRNGSLTIAILDATAHALARGDGQRLYTLVMRWLASGSMELYGNVSELLGPVQPPPFDTTAAELNLSTLQQIFVCRKAIGYLFIKPVVCCSIIVSVLRAANDEVAAALSDLIFDPVLVNYGGEARDYLKAIRSDDPAHAYIQAALAKDEGFQTGLGSVGTICELHPSEYKRDVVRQRMHDEMREVHKLAESKSVLLNLVHRSTILYGKRALNYVVSPDGQQRAVAMDLKSFGTSFELPRHEILDPVGLDYILRIFRVEKLK